MVRLRWLGDPGQEHLTLTTDGVTIQATSFELTGDTTIAAAQSSLRAATYINTAEEPNISNRTIEVTLYSGDGTRLTTVYRYVWIVYVNDHAPDGQILYEFTVLEELAIGEVAEQIVPIDNDKDISPSFTFSLRGSVSIPFQLSASTGKLLVSSRISFEVMASYQFEVSLTNLTYPWCL